MDEALAEARCPMIFPSIRGICDMPKLCVHKEECRSQILEVACRLPSLWP